MNVRPVILGDGAYPASTWLLKPHPFQNNLTQEQKKYHRVLSSSRCVAENAFGLLKSRWRCLMKRIDNNLENVSGIVMSCVILHNICQRRKDEYIDDGRVLDEVIRQERNARQEIQANNNFCRDGDALREHLTQYLLE